MARGRSYRVPGLLLAAFFLVSACMFTSLGQILLEPVKRIAPENRKHSLLPDNPVFSPLASLRSRDLQYSPGAHVIYNSDALPETLLAVQASEWWLPEFGDLAESDPFDSIDVVSFPGKFAGRSQFPVPKPGDFDFHAAAGELVNLGVADILNFLREKEVRREKSGTGTNPFDEALAETPDETVQGKNERRSEADPPKADDEVGDDSSSGGGSSAARSFLFVGGFGGPSVQAVVGTAGSYLSSDKPAVFDLDGIGETPFNLDIVLRSRENQESVAFGALNGDGFIDLVVTNRTDNQAYIYLNDGNGNYIHSASISGGLGPSMAAIGDFSGDGTPDISVMLEIDKRIIVEGKGLRKYTFYPTSPAIEGSSSMIPYDFNGDGLNDLLLTNYRNFTATVYRNEGGAFFTPADAYPLQSFPCIQYSVDLNGDWVEDRVSVQYLGSQVSIVFQNGSDGAISSIANTILDPSLYYALGDFNNDGVVDIALARRNQ